jgi:hypothetical protein
MLKGPIVDEYFELSRKIDEYEKAKEVQPLLECCARQLTLVKEFVNLYIEEKGSFPLTCIASIDNGMPYWSAKQDAAALNRVKEIVDSIPELVRWRKRVEQAVADVELSKRIRNYVSLNPGTLQRNLGKSLGLDSFDSTRIVNVLANLGIVKKTKSKNTYKLRLNDNMDNTM